MINLLSAKIHKLFSSLLCEESIDEKKSKDEMNMALASLDRVIYNINASKMKKCDRCKVLNAFDAEAR